MALKLQDGQTIVFIGDSITDCGRRDSAAPLGSGYVRYVTELIAIRYPHLNLTYHNRGISGNTILDLRNRWQTDLIDLKPDWVSVLIGINDVHWYFNDANSLPPETYETTYRECLTLMRERTHAQLLVMEPFYIVREREADDTQTKVLKALAPFRQAAAKLAKEFKAKYIPLHAHFQEHLKYRPANTFCPEPVHPNSMGHLLMAHAWLKEMGW